MKINQAGRDLIQQFEQCRLKAYLPTAGDKPTIGWGHTVDVKLGQAITQHQADVMFDVDLGDYEAAVEKMAPGANENQFAAMVSFAYNCGVGALQGSTLLKKYLRGDAQGAAWEFLKWVRGPGGIIMVGLQRRRLAEKNLFLRSV